MQKSEKVELLAKAPIFYGLSDDILGQIADVAEESEAASGQTFIAADSVEPWMFLVVSGEARVHRDGRTIATVAAGATVGELAVLDPAPRSADVTAVEDCRLLRLDHAHLAELRTAQPELTEGIIAMLVRIIRANSDKIGPESVSAV